MNDDKKNFFKSQELNHGTMFEPHILTVFHFDLRQTGVMDSCGLQVMYGDGETWRNCAEPMFSSFSYTNKKYDREGKNFSAPPTISISCYSLGDLWRT